MKSHLFLDNPLMDSSLSRGKSTIKFKSNCILTMGVKKDFFCERIKLNLLSPERYFSIINIFFIIFPDIDTFQKDIIKWMQQN